MTAGASRGRCSERALTWLTGSLKLVMSPARRDVFSSSDSALRTQNTPAVELPSVTTRPPHPAQSLRFRRRRAVAWEKPHDSTRCKCLLRCHIRLAGRQAHKKIFVAPVSTDGQITFQSPFTNHNRVCSAEVGKNRKNIRVDHLAGLQKICPSERPSHTRNK